MVCTGRVEKGFRLVLQVPFQNADDRPAVADGAPGARSRRRGQGRLLPPAHHPCAGDVVAGRCSSCCWCWNRTSSRARSSDEGGGCCGWERCRAAATWPAASPPSSRGEGGAAAAAAGAWVGGTAACARAARVQRRAGLRTARLGTGAARARGRAPSSACACHKHCVGGAAAGGGRQRGGGGGLRCACSRNGST